MWDGTPTVICHTGTETLSHMQATHLGNNTGLLLEDCQTVSSTLTLAKASEDLGLKIRVRTNYLRNLHASSATVTVS